MPHKRKPRSPLDQRLLAAQRPYSAAVAKVIDFPQGEGYARKGNLIPSMSGEDVMEVRDLMTRRFYSAEATTNEIASEIERAERQFHGLFPDQEKWQEPDPDDNRIYLRKTMEHCQIVHAHLDHLTSQLDPLLVLEPEMQGLMAPEEQYAKAKRKELLLNFYLRRNKFTDDVLPRWRWKFLLHPSAYIRVCYGSDANEPDLRYYVVDRAALYIDPLVKDGNIKHAGWTIEKDWISQEEVDDKVRKGEWSLDQEGMPARSLSGVQHENVLERIVGRNMRAGYVRGPDRDQLVEVWHYFQAPKNGQPHAYGVMLGGPQGTPVRWGPNPWAYKGIPYRGKAYLPDPHKPDGVSLAMQYRSINEVGNTFLNLRVEDVLENVKSRVFVLESMFGPETEQDLSRDQKYIRTGKAFAEQHMDDPGFDLRKYMNPMQQGTSTQELLQDLQYIGQEGQAETSIGDAFRGQNPQTGATLGQVQQQLTRAVGVFWPIARQELTMIVELGEITNTYFEDPDFFGEERIVSFTGPNKYASQVPGFVSNPSYNAHALRVMPDDMDVDVSVNVLDQAKSLANKTMRMTMIAQTLEATRHHPELAKEASQRINFTNIMSILLRDAGVPKDEVEYSPEERAVRAKAQQAQKEQEQAAQLQQLSMQAEAAAKGQILIDTNKARAEAQVAQITQDQKHQDKLEEVIAKVSAEHKAAMEQLTLENRHTLQQMVAEFRMELRAMAAGLAVSVAHGSNAINKPSER